MTCSDFDQSVYDLAMESVLDSAGFSEATCANTDDDDGAEITNEISVPLAEISEDASVLSHVTDALVEAVSTGALTSAIQSYARRRLANGPERRLSMADAVAHHGERQHLHADARAGRRCRRWGRRRRACRPRRAA